MAEALYLQIDIDLPADRALDVTIVLDAHRPFVDLLGYYELLYDETSPRRDRSRVILYFPAAAEQAGLRAELLLAGLDIQDWTLSESLLNREDYQNTYKQYFKPLAVGPRLAIIPQWHRDSPEAAAVLTDGRLPLVLDPGMAFGTGSHPTTRLCLEALSEHVHPGDLVCDAGCGSGVLSIGAALLGAAEVFAFDVEENAIQASMHNFSLNDHTDRIQLVRGGFELPALRAFLERANLVVANLTAAILIGNKGVLSGGAYPRLLLSGIWRDHRAGVEAAFLGEAEGPPVWRLEKTVEQEGWLLLNLVRIANRPGRKT